MKYIQRSCLENTEMPNYDLMNEVFASMQNNLNNQMETAIIEGLKRKGFEFENKFELEEFAKKHCRWEDNLSFKERVYYVNDIPFFLWKYRTEISSPITLDKKTTISGSYGTFAYL